MHCSTPGSSIYQFPVVCSNSYPLSQQWYRTTLFSATSFPSCLQSFPASGSFPVSWIFASHGQSIGASASVPSEYSELISFRIDWFDLLAVQGTLKSFPAPQFKNTNSSGLSLLHGPSFTSTHDYWKYHSFEYMELCQQNDVSDL